MAVIEIRLNNLDFNRRDILRNRKKFRQKHFLIDLLIKKKSKEQERKFYKNLIYKLNRLLPEEVNKILDHNGPYFKKIIEIAQGNDQNAIEVLFKKYWKMIEAVARKYFLPKSEFEDLRQEAMIGFWDAIRNYKPSIINNFSYFAKLCTLRDVMTAVRGANRDKHSPLNSYISIFEPDYKIEQFTTHINPENIFLLKEQLIIFLQIIKGEKGDLSELERLVIEYFHLRGFSYKEIASKLSDRLKRKITYKAVDNATQRAREKLPDLWALLYPTEYRPEISKPPI